MLIISTRRVRALARRRVRRMLMRQGEGCGVERDNVRTCIYVNRHDEIVEYRGIVPAYAVYISTVQNLGGVL